MNSPYDRDVKLYPSLDFDIKKIPAKDEDEEPT